jgi:hypothetical protein
VYGRPQAGARARAVASVLARRERAVDDEPAVVQRPPVRVRGLILAQRETTGDLLNAPQGGFHGVIAAPAEMIAAPSTCNTFGVIVKNSRQTLY